MRALGLNGNRLAKVMQLPYGTIQSLTSGRSKTFRYMPELAKALETSVDWLLTGEGQPDDNIVEVSDLARKLANVQLIEVLITAAKRGLSPSEAALTAARRQIDILLSKPEGQQMSGEHLLAVVRAILEDSCKK